MSVDGLGLRMKNHHSGMGVLRQPNHFGHGLSSVSSPNPPWDVNESHRNISDVHFSLVFHIKGNHLPNAKNHLPQATGAIENECVYKS